MIAVLWTLSFVFAIVAGISLGDVVLTEEGRRTTLTQALLVLEETSFVLALGGLAIYATGISISKRLDRIIVDRQAADR